jgi:hypothetical protein
MQNQFEAPALTLIGEAEQVVLGISDDGIDMGLDTAPDFEFELD